MNRKASCTLSGALVGLVFVMAFVPAEARRHPASGSRPITDLTIPKVYPIDEENRVIRGPAPGRKITQFPYVGITDVMIIKEQKTNEVDNEIRALRKVGYEEDQTLHLPLKWQNVDATVDCEHTVAALRRLLEVHKTADRRIYFHCTAGEDRTGMVAGLFRMLTQNWSLDKAFQTEMCGRGYAEGNPKKPRNVAVDVRRNLTPLFTALAGLIQAGRLTEANLDQKVCSSREYQGLLRSTQLTVKVRQMSCAPAAAMAGAAAEVEE